MHIVSYSDNLVCTLLPKQTYSEEKNYRFPAFVGCFEHDNKILAFNTLTRMLVEFTESEYDKLLSSKNREMLEQCVSNYFLVPEDHNDFSLVKQVKETMRLIYRSTMDRFVILTTTNCNARCFYCFEYGTAKKTMTTQTALDVAEFINRKTKSRKILLDWFGGEPLCNAEAIDTICSRLTSKGIEYESSMISNGYLFDDEIIKKSISLWNLTKVQITIDGTERIYNATKNYISESDTSPFNRVVYNIKKLVELKIKVLIRMNLGEHNKSDLYQLITNLSKKFNGYQDYITMYVWLLYDERGISKKTKTEEERHALLSTLFELEHLIDENGYARKSPVSSRLIMQACYADDDRTFIILPDGMLGKCDHSLEDKLIGNIYNDKFDNDVIRGWKELREPIELCKTCMLFPQCLKLKQCHDDGAYDCDEFEQKKQLEKLRKLIINRYEKHKGASIK